MKSDIIVLISSLSLIGGISWFFFGGKKNETKDDSFTGEFETVEFNITGMHCAGCAAGIEATIKLLDGVKTASVNFGTSKGIFTFDPSKVKREDIINKIRELGYDVSLNLEDFEKKS
ncbi:MAG: heavy metal-associated domain-containing protein [Hydrogenothermaceae bacterium]